ncbi:tyrosine-type recombinase/integrase [Thermodesulfobacteriota bacterium]
MSVYFHKSRGRWRYDFTLAGKRYTQTGFKTKAKARKAEADRKEAIQRPQHETDTQTDMVFSDLLNKRLDYVKAYKSEGYYRDYIYYGRRWVGIWGDLCCSKITTGLVEQHLVERRAVSPITANTDLRYLKAVFNFGIKRKCIKANPCQGIEFFPVERKIKYVPPPEDVAAVILAADPDTQNYLCCIQETLARVSEINRLTWDDVDLVQQYVVLYTRKKKGGHLTPRKVPMTKKLHGILSRRYKNRDREKPWVFWHRHWDKKQRVWVEGPYKDRKGIMKALCKKAGVKYFRFHALRHLGASQLDENNAGIGAIQRILGHENRSTTEIYLHSIGESEREAMLIFEQVNSQCAENPHTNPHTRQAQKKRRSESPL